MDPCYTNSIDHRRRPFNHRRDTLPSFSSTLLDQIYLSIDDSVTNPDISMTTNKQHQHRDESLNENRFCNRRKTVEPVFFKHSSSSSSDSSGFSSSESDSFYKRTCSSRSQPEIFHPKPIRTTVERFKRSPEVHRVNNKQEHGSFLRTKSKALKIYSDLKKLKQPDSPGGRLATFLNSLFTGAGNTKKSNKTNKTVTAATSSTTCSSASSFSRSCLSKTPSSSEKSKRSVRFCPVNEESNTKPETKSIRHNQNFDTLTVQEIEENRRVIEAAKELLRTYQKNKVVINISDEEDDDDAASCTSSDLFELDNLSAIGIERYKEELPVFETTRFNRNRITSK